jgi:hypothetical protein
MNRKIFQYKFMIYKLSVYEIENHIKNYCLEIFMHFPMLIFIMHFIQLVRIYFIGFS